MSIAQPILKPHIKSAPSNKLRHWPWRSLSLLIAACVLLPVASIVLLAFNAEQNIWPELAATLLPTYLRETLLLLVGVGCVTLVIGVSTAWLVGACEFPGRRLFEWALLLPFAVPAYVIAYVYTDLLEYAGPVQRGLRAWMGWSQPSDYWFPEIRSLGGAMVVMGLVLYPYVFMLGKVAFREQSPSLRYASRSLGLSAWQSFRRVTLPMCRPALAVGLALVLMETLNDFGTVDFFAVRTLTAGIYDTWLNLGSLGGAAQIASLMLTFVVLLVLIERFSRRRQQLYTPAKHAQRPERVVLQGWQGRLALAYCSLILILGFILPAGILGHYAWRYFDDNWNSQFISLISNSFGLAFSAAGLAAVLAVCLAYSKRLHDRGINRQAAQAAGLGYALPGAVLAIGIIIPFASFDNALDAWMRSQFGLSTGLLLSGSVVTLVFAYVVRFLAVAIGSTETSLNKVTPSMDMAARSLGLNSRQTLFRVHLPMIRGGVLTGALVVFVDCMKELPATLILRPFNFETLATYVYQYASDEQLEQCALAALVIVLVGLIPIIAINRVLERPDVRVTAGQQASP